MLPMHDYINKVRILYNNVVDDENSVAVINVYRQLQN